jgi:hypothetical protein
VDLTASLDDTTSRRFTRTFLAIVLAGLALSVSLAVLVDPLQTFGTGRIPSILTNEREEKTTAFLHADPAPQLVVLGSSRVYKANPTCLRELTGLPSFNFGLGFARIEDELAVMRFIHDRGRVPLKQVIIGLDVDAFDHQDVDQRTLSSKSLRRYIDGLATLSWDRASRSLFGMQGLHFGLTSLWYHFRKHPPPKSEIGADGFVTYKAWEDGIRKGTFDSTPLVNALARKLEFLSTANNFNELSRPRVAMFEELVRSAHAAGIEVRVFIPPLHPKILAARAKSSLPERTREMEAMLERLQSQGLLTYFPIEHPEDYGTPKTGWFDGNHMTEPMTTKILLAMFHRDHGCGM